MLTNERFQAPAGVIGAELASLLIADGGEMIGSGRGGARREAATHLHYNARRAQSTISEVSRCVR